MTFLRHSLLTLRNEDLKVFVVEAGRVDGMSSKIVRNIPLRRIDVSLNQICRHLRSARWPAYDAARRRPQCVHSSDDWSNGRDQHDESTT